VVLNWEAAYGRAFQIQVSANATTWTTVYSATAGADGVNDLAVTDEKRQGKRYRTLSVALSC
jgi:hypothetical protein